MSSKPRNRAGIDADAVARMMREQDDQTEAVEPAEAAQEAAPPALAPAPAEPAPPPPAVPASTAVGPREAIGFDPGKVDGRTLRRTGREPFATRIKPETHEALRRIAYGRRITIAEALELAVAAYDVG